MHILKQLFQKYRPRSCVDLLRIRLPITVQRYSENLNPFEDLIFKDLLFEQFFPIKPGTQAQLYSFTPSVHVPLFRHGFG